MALKVKKYKDKARETVKETGRDTGTARKLKKLAEKIAPTDKDNHSPPPPAQSHSEPPQQEEPQPSQQQPEPRKPESLHLSEPQQSQSQPEPQPSEPAVLTTESEPQQPKPELQEAQPEPELQEAQPEPEPQEEPQSEYPDPRSESEYSQHLAQPQPEPQEAQPQLEPQIITSFNDPPVKITRLLKYEPKQEPPPKHNFVKFLVTMYCILLPLLFATLFLKRRKTNRKTSPKVPTASAPVQPSDQQSPEENTTTSPVFKRSSSWMLVHAPVEGNNEFDPQGVDEPDSTLDPMEVNE